MKKRISTNGKMYLLTAAIVLSVNILFGQSKSQPMSNTQMLEVLKKTENTISFIENKGQWGQNVRVAGHTNVGSMYVMNDHIHFLSTKEEEHQEEETAEADEIHTREAHGWGIFLDGSNPNYQLRKDKVMPTTYNYFFGNADQHSTDIRSFGEVTMGNIYDGVDLRIYSQGDNVMEFDWLVNAGADFNNIKMRFKGQEGLRIDEKGSLAVKLHFDEVKFDIPEAYQIIDGKKVAVKMAFSIKGDVATFRALGKVDNRYALVIDPSVKWGTWFDCNSNTFDEYLFAVDIDNSGNVYCGGIANMQLPAGTYAGQTFGYDATYNDAGTGGNGGNRDAILYKISSNGAQLLAVTYFGGSGLDGIYGLSLSPDKSTVFVCGYTSSNATTFPLVNTPFDGTFNTGREGFVAAFSAPTLNALNYSTYLGHTGAGDNMYTIHAINNTDFIVGGVVNADLAGSTATYISASAMDATYSGDNEMYIAKFTGYRTLAFGTYVGGTGSDKLNDLDILDDGSIAFSGSSTSATSFPALVNNLGAGGSTGSADGILGVLNSNGQSAQMLSRIGGTGADEFFGLAIGVFDTLFVTGFTSSTDFWLGPNSAGNRFSTVNKGAQDAIIGKAPRAGWNGTGTNPWQATYFGGTGDDRANCLKTYTPYAVTIFGETASNSTAAASRFPVQNLQDGGTFYDSTHNGGTWDIFWFVIGTDLKTQYFGTYLGGTGNDYLGETGVPSGSNHFVVEGDSLVVLGTTVHSTALNPNVIANSFDLTNNTAGDDIHLIFKWRIGILLNFDYADAPASYGTPNHIVFNALKIGSNIDKEDFAQPSYKAFKDDSLGTTPDDEDGITGTGSPYFTIVNVQDTSTRFSQVVNVTNNTGTTAILCGWIDFNRDGDFLDANEVDTVLVPASATTATLRWTGYNVGGSPFFNLTNDTTYLRLRLTTQASFFVTNPSPTISANNGEVEDYMVLRFHCVNLTSATIDTNGTSTCGSATGSIVITNDTIIAGVQYGVYYSKNGGPLQGPFYYTTTGSGIAGTLTISGLTAGTYTAVQVFHPTNPACGFTLPGSYVITDPATPPAPGLNPSSTAVCVGGSFTLTASSSQASPTYNWAGPNGYTFTGNPAVLTNAQTNMAGTYTVTQTVAGCTSLASSVTIAVNLNPTVNAGGAVAAICQGGTSVALGGSFGGGATGAVWSAPSGSFSNNTGATPGTATFTAAANSTTPITLTITSTGGSCGTVTATKQIVVNPNPTANAGAAMADICQAATSAALGGSVGGGATGGTWSSSAGGTFNPSATNLNATWSPPSGYFGTATLTLTTSGGSCGTTTASKTIVVNPSPTANAGAAMAAICQGSTSAPLNGSVGGSATGGTWSTVSGGTFNPNANTLTATWTPPSGFSGTATLVLTTTGGPCGTANASKTIQVNPSPTANAGGAVAAICQGGTSVALGGSFGGGATSAIWSDGGAGGTFNNNTGSTPNTTTYTAAANSTSPVTLTLTTSGGGCGTATATKQITVNPNPTVNAGPAIPGICQGSTTIALGGSFGGGATGAVWSAPSGTFANNGGSTPGTATYTAATNAVSPITLTLTSIGGSCGTVSTTKQITINPNLSVTAGSNSPVCTGGTLNLTSSLSGSYTYVWSGPSAYAASVQNPSRPGATSAYQGTYNVTVTDANGCSGSAATNVVVNQGVSVTASSNSPVCVGSTLSLNATSAGGTSPFGYSWNGPASFSSGTQSPTRTNAQTTYGGAYNVTITDANFCSATSTTNVLINLTPSVTAGSNTPVCSGATINLTSNPSGGNGSYGYAWSGPVSYTANTQNPTRSGALTTFTGSYSLTVTDGNGCSATTATSVTVNPSPTVSNSSNSPVCETRTISLTSTPSGGNGSYTYLWSGPVTFSANTQNPTRTNAISSYGGAYNLTITDGNNCTASASTTISVLPKPGAPTAGASPNPVCTGQTLSLSGTGSGASTWNWYGPNSFASTNQNPSIAGVTLAAAGTYSLYQTLSGCSSDTATVTVTVNSTPAAPVITTVVPNPVCTGQSVTFTASGAGGATFSWTGPNSFSQSGNPVTIASAALTNAGNYTVTQTVTGCTSSASAPVTLTVNQTPTAATPTSNSPVCYGGTLNLFESTIPGATYSWSGPGFTSSLQNPTRTNATPLMSGVYSVTVTVNGCSNTNSATVTATVTSCPPVAVDDSYSTNEDTPLTIAAPGVLTNDNDPAGQPLTVTTTPISGPSNGSLTLNSNGSFTYTPNTNYNGTDVFCYRVCDNESPVACDTACVTITVNPVNDKPVVNDSIITTPEDVPVTVCLPISDLDVPVQPHTVTLCGGPANGSLNGTLSVNNGTAPHTVCFTYTPNLNYNGTDQVCLIVCDNAGGCDTATVNITVTPVNDRPVANDDYYTNCTGTAIANNVMSNDNDVDGPFVTLLGPLTGPFSGGSLSLSGTGSFTYTPVSPLFNGLDSFTYVICDGGTPNLCDTATAILDYSCVNVPPVAVNDNYNVNEDQVLTISAPGILANDFDQDGGAITLNTPQLSGPSHGSLTLNANGSFVYTPTANYYGLDTFQYVICDTDVPVKCDTGSVFITVNPVNDNPTVTDTVIVTCEDCGPVTVCRSITDVETDQDYYVSGLLCGPNSGTVSTSVNNTSNTLCVSYTSNLNFNGVDSVCVILCDNGIPNLCDTIRIPITVTPVNDKPVANDDAYATNEDTPLIIIAPGVLSNDSDPADGTTVTVTGVVSGPSNGTLTLNANGSFSYTPSSNFTGTDVFCYRIIDNGTPLPALADTACVTITVNPVNDPPVVNDTVITQCEDCGPITVCLPVSNPDAGQSLNVAAVLCGPNSGTYSTSLVVNTLCVTYTSNNNFNGNDSICVVVCDNGSPILCDTTKIRITVTPVNDPPVANNDTYSTNEDTPLNISAPGVLANDNDAADGTTVTVTNVVSGPSNGTVTLNANGSFTYTPNSNYNGTDVFCYRIIDNGTPLPALADTACVTITINSVNDAPVVNDSTVTIPEDGSITVCLPIADGDSASQLHTVSICDAPNNGSITSGPVVNNIGLPHTVCVTYVPTANFNGSDSICLTICDNGIPFLCDNAVIRINVTPVNDPPVANDDSYSTNEDTPLTVSAPGVLSNDSDPVDGTSVTVTNVTSGPSNGSVTLNANGSFTYIPNSGYNGIDVFCYRIIDAGTPGPGLADTACVTITINQVNDPPHIPDTTVTTCEDCPINICVPYTDADTADIHTATLLCPGQNGTVSGITVNQSTNTICFNYVSYQNLNGTDSVCVVVCDNGVPQRCDTSTITILVTPVNDPPYADTIYVVTYENQPIGVNVSSATGDVEGNPLTYTYGAVTPNNGTYAITGNGAVVVTPNTGFTGTFAIPYTVCDLSPYVVNILCDGAAIVVTVLPSGDTLVNHSPVANNDYVTTPFNTGIVVNELANDYDPDGDVLQVTVTNTPNNGSYTVNAGGTINYTPNTGFFGFDTIGYTVCDPTAANNPKPLCDNAIIVIYVSKDSTANVNDAPVAVDDFATICSDATVTLSLLNNDSDPNGDAITSVIIIDNVNNGTLTAGSLGIYLYDPNAGFNGFDTLVYRICDNGSPSLCDTAVAVIRVFGNPVITPSVSSLTNCSNDSVNITFTSSISGSVITWSASNGTNGAGDIHTVLTNNTSSNQIVTYSVLATSAGGCGSTTLTIPVTVKPRPTATATVNATTFCSGDNVVINISSNISGSTYTWSGSNGTSGTGNVISDNPVNSGTSSIIVTYSIVGTSNGCSGDTLQVPVTVKPKPVLTVTPSTQTVCSGTAISIDIASTVSGTTVNWFGSNGNSGNSFTINDSPVNIGTSNLTVTYTINGSFNGCAANTVFSTVVVRPRVVADAGQDKSATSCSGSCVQIGGSPTGSGGTGSLTYNWTPVTGLSSTTSPNPNACNLSSTTTYTVVVSDASNCSATDAMVVTITPSSLTAEAGTGGALCSGSGDSVMLGGFPTAVGGVPPYSYTWAPSGLNLTNPANPYAFPATTTKYYLTVTDALGCVSIDSSTVIVYPSLTADAGLDTAVCLGFPANLGGLPTASGGSGSGYSYSWAPSVGVSNITVANPTATPPVTTSYVVTVTDGNGCRKSDTVQVVIRPVPTALAGPDKSLSVCPGDSVILGDNPPVVGGTPSYTYSWSPSTGFTGASNIPNPVVKNLSATTTYTLNVTDANGCSATDNVIVTVTPNTLQAKAGNDASVCSNNNCVQIGGLPTAVGGNSPYTYAWSNAGSLSNAAASNPLGCPSATSTFSVTVTDSRGCSATDAIVVTVNPTPVTSAGPDTTVCIGSTITIGGSPSASGGTPGYSYSWQPTTGLSLPNVANPLASPAVVTTYQLIVIDSKGCSTLDEVTVTPRNNPIVDAGSDLTLVNCAADTACVVANITSGTTPYTYVWTPSTGLTSTTTANTCVTGITTTTSYQLQVTDVYGCIGSDFVTVNVTPSTLQADAGNAGTLCANAGASLAIGGNPTAVGGTSPYVYTWASAPAGFASSLSNPVVTPNGTTKYYVTVTDAKGCQSFDSVSVNVNPAPAVNAGLDTTICSGFCVTIGGIPTGSAGTTPYQYSWTPTLGLNANNTANPLACPLITTTYTVQLTDSNGCITTDAVTVTVRPNPVANAGVDKTLTSCGGDSVQIGGSPSGSGGTPNYTYSWSPSTGLNGNTTVTNPWVKGINASQLYTLVVTDANGCTAEDAVLVNVVPSNLSADAGNGGSYCAGSGGSVTLGSSPTAVGGSPAYSYSWSGGLASVANPLASPSSTTKYYVTITDSKGCLAIDSATVIVNPAPAANAGNDTAICLGSSVNLGGTPAASGGTSGYTYSWTPGVGLSSSSASNPTANPVITTTYVLVVTDANGCSATDNIAVAVRSNPVANAGLDKTLVACSADSVQIGGSPTATGGGGTYTYTWSPALGLSSDVIANPYVSHIGSSSNYTVTVTDQFGCSATDQVAVIVNNPSLVAEAGNNVAFCQGASVSVTLGGSPTAVGGTPSYTYTWTPLAGLNDSTLANPVATPLTSTTYSVAVKDATGCIAEDTVRITINPRPVVNAGVPDTICSGVCVELGGAPTASGGTGSYTYNWTPTFFFSTPTTVANPTVCPTNNVTYVVTATDSLGCSNNASVTIRVNQNPTANAGVDKTLVACPDACITIGGTPTATGGGGGYLYAWAPSAGLNNTGLANPSVCNLAQSVTYNLTVTDANGCTAIDQTLINVVQSTLTADAGNDKSICAGQPTCITIGGTNAVTGGSTPYLIEWSPVAGICNANNIANPDVNPTDTTTYILLVTDALGCVAIDSMVVYANPAVTASVSPDTAICQGGSALLGSNPTGSGGTPNYTYSWSPGTGLSSTTSGNPVATPLVTTAYCVTVTDAVGCSSSTCQNVNVNAGVFADAGQDKTITSCPGAFVVIGGSPVATGGSGNYSYAWSPSTGLNGTTIPNPIVSNITVTTTYTLSVTDNATGCSSVDLITVTVNPTTLDVDAGTNKVFCANSTSCVQIGGNPTATGGVTPYIYQWAPIAGLSDASIANPCASPLNTTTYYLTVTDQLGCFITDSVVVNVSPLIAVNAGIDTLICGATSIVLGGNPVAVGGTLPYTYQWSAGAFPSNTDHPTATPLSNTSYTLTVTDSLGCSASDIVNINLRTNPTASAGPDATITACSADSAVLGGSPTGSGGQSPYTYLWNPPVALSNIAASNPTVRNLGFTTLYTVTVIDSFGCRANDEVQVTVLPNTLFVEAGVNVGSLCSNVSGCVTLGGSPTVSGGVGPYVFNWIGTGVTDPTSAHPQACPTGTTTYTVVVTDQDGCQASDTVLVVVNTPTEVSIVGATTPLLPQYCVGSPNVLLAGVPAGGTFTGPFVTGNVFQPISVGNWCITYEYTNPATGCTDDTTVCITVNPLPVVSFSGLNANYCRADTCATLTGTPAGGTFSGSGISGNTFCPSAAALGNSVITYSYTDPQTGCSNTATFTVNVKDVPVLDLSVSSNTVCAGATAVVTPTYSFDVFNIAWSVLGGSNIGSGLNPITVSPTGVDYCIIGTAINTPNGCISRDTICIHVNQNPVANSDTANTCEEEFVVVDVTGNDTDPEGNNNTVTVLSSPNGVTSVNGGSVTYTPNLNYNGVDVVTYILCNTNCPNACDTGTVLINICPINDPPVITDITDTIYENTIDTVCPIIVDVDDASSTLTVNAYACQSLNGTVSVENGCVIYTPTLNWTGTQVICVSVCDTSGACDTGTVTIVVLPTNNAPIAEKINVTVCNSTSIGINVSSAVVDPDGDPLSFSYGSVTGPVGSTWAFNVTGNGAVVFSADLPGNYFIPYYVCDQSGIPPFSLCDTNLITVRVIVCDSLNEPPVANDDNVITTVSTGTTINELANDFDPDGDPLNVTILSGPLLVGATANVNPNGTISYNSPVIGIDQITYIICDPYNACDTAVITIYVDSTTNSNHPPVAVDDFETTDYGTPVVVNVLGNDHDPDGNPILVTVIPCPASDGVATVTSNGNTITYIPGPNANALNPDTFCYVICEVANPNSCDTANVVVYINNSVQGVADCGNNVTGRENPIDINVLANDFDPELDSFWVSTVLPITGTTHGTATVNADGSLHYIPANDTCDYTDTISYVIEDIHGATDTVDVCIYIDCCRKPVANTDSSTIIPGDVLIIDVQNNDVTYGVTASTTILSGPAHGSAVLNGSTVTYTPNANHCGLDTVQYTISSYCGADTGLLIVLVNCNQKPDAEKDFLSMCINDTATICVLANDTDPDGNTLSISGFGSAIPNNLGQVVAVDGCNVTFQSNGTAGAFSLRYYTCDNGLPSKCDTNVIVVQVLACIPTQLDTIYDTTCVMCPDTVCLDGVIVGNNNPTITSLCDPQNGTVEILSDSLCFVYTPNQSFIGNDTFCIIACDTLGYCDTSVVIITVVDPLIQAVDEPCDLDTAYLNSPITIRVLDNDILPVAADTTISLITLPVSGTAVVNPDNSVTYTPNNNFEGGELFSYLVCAVSGNYSYCDTATICITVVDTTVDCYIPNGFSPNGDGVNDEYLIPCNSNYPDATLRIFDRWGVEVWFSEGPYTNNWDGRNMQGIVLPDGTYYLIYEYNDGSGKREAKFVVIHR